MDDAASLFEKDRLLFCNRDLGLDVRALGVQDYRPYRIRMVKTG